MSELKNTEITAMLNTAIEKLRNEIVDLESEFDELNSSESLTRKQKSRIKNIKKEIENKNSKIDEIEEDVQYLNELNEKINEYNDALHSSRSKDKAALAYVGDKKNEKKAEEAMFIEGLEEKYRDLLYGTEEKESKFKNTLKSNKKKIIAIIASLAALGLIGTITFGVVNSKKNNSTKDPSPSVSSTPDPNPTKTPKPTRTPEPSVTPSSSPVEEGTFTDIHDEEQVAIRASEFMDLVNENNPGNDHSIEEIENITRWINNGKVEAVSQEEALFAVTRLETLWNKENQGEVEKPFDISMLFKDGSRGQRLASKIYDIRVKLMSAETEEEYRKYAEEFTVLLVNSWYLNGKNDEISAYELETSFMEAVIDKYFLNTYAMISAKNINVTIDGEIFNLDKVAIEINKATCETEVTADNGETFTIYINKFSSDMIGAVSEASQAKEDSYGLSLTNN